MSIYSFFIAIITACRLFLYLTPAIFIIILVFVIAGLFSKVLAGVFDKAITYKLENDLMAMRKKNLTELAGEIDITLANLSILKNNKAKAIRLSTLNEICKALDCQPGDLLQYVEDEE